ncbi:unnamed protein product [Cylicocyclus nassatus]|uniref:Uncharacterized protein n=1 Tax=Cylicocyclus nassatus TaxID=53992 RepID=A0AA36GY10_CYLNA|nr:unnamed protein product [Cylicocyclus nassatus]
MTELSSPEHPEYSKDTTAEVLGNLRSEVVHPTFAYYLTRMSMARTAEETLEVFSEMKKTPHLTGAFIKLCYQKQLITKPTSDAWPTMESALSRGIRYFTMFSQALTPYLHIPSMRHHAPARTSPFPFLVAAVVVNTFVVWLINKWIRSREEGAHAETTQVNAETTQKINSSLKSLMGCYEELQGQIQELKDELAILRKEKREFGEEMRCLEHKANEQGERMASLKISMESELKATKEHMGSQLGRVMVFNEEIQEHKKRIADLESKRFAEVLQQARICLNVAFDY